MVRRDAGMDVFIDKDIIIPSLRAETEDSRGLLPPPSYKMMTDVGRQCFGYHFLFLRTPEFPSPIAHYMYLLHVMCLMPCCEPLPIHNFMSLLPLIQRSRASC